MIWKMTCLICEHADTNLVGMQEHQINEHGRDSKEFRNQTAEVITPGKEYRYVFADGTAYMRAVKES